MWVRVPPGVPNSRRRMCEKRALVSCDAAKQDVHVEVAAANAGIA